MCLTRTDGRITRHLEFYCHLEQYPVPVLLVQFKQYPRVIRAQLADIPVFITTC